ncbi:60S ribosomal protein L18a-like protein [Senna tora]|uniref:60S ribosomal protein L18a-like protein n=1 Tax=Senna tora TaxID=362788 RepID=A0A834THZ3_9FABA|nr:60S ribosomal protein L18a-like protein [Senna tora]
MSNEDDKFPPPETTFPQHVPPPASVEPPPYYSDGYQAVPGYPVAEGTPVTVRARQRRLPCCGVGCGWCLFILGFFLAIPWYVGTLILLCVRIDYREKPGFLACSIAAAITTVVAIIIAATKGSRAS